MTLTPIYASPGVQLTNSPYAQGKQFGAANGRTALGRYSVASNIEFIEGFPQKVAGFTALVAAGAMKGVPRAIRSWRDATGTVRLAIGTDSHLYTCLSDGTGLTDITPRNMFARQITTADAVTSYTMNYFTTAGSALVQFNFTAGSTAWNLAGSAVAVGDYVMFNTDAAFATNTGMTPFQGSYQIIAAVSDTYITLTNNSVAIATVGPVACKVNLVLMKTMLGASPLATVSGSPTVTVTMPQAYTVGWDTNGIPTTCGMYVTFSGATVFNNVTISGEYLIAPTVGNSTQFTIQAGTNANATSSGGGSNVIASFTPAMNQYFTAPQPSAAISFSTRVLPSASAWSALTYGLPGYVAVATGTSAAAYSLNGTSWTATTMPSSGAWSCVTYGKATYLAMVAGTNVIATSTDGQTWTGGTLPTSTGTYITPGVGSFTDNNGSVYTITAGGVAQLNGNPIPSDPGNHQAGEYYAGIIYFQSAVSPFTWYTFTPYPYFIWAGTWAALVGSPPAILSGAVNWSSVAYGAGVFVAVASTVGGSPSQIVVNSANGQTGWTQGAMPVAAKWQAIVYNGSSMFVAIAGGSVTSTNVAASSVDGVTWTQRTLPSTTTWQSVAWGNNRFCAVAGGTAPSSVAATSPDGITWTVRTLPVSAAWTTITYGNGAFIAFAGGSSNTTCAVSIDGIVWTQRTMPATDPWTYAAAGAGGTAVICTSTTVAAVTPIALVATPNILPVGWTLAAYGGLMVASPIGGTIYLYDPLNTNASPAIAYPLGNAPGHCCAMFVTPERIIVALGASQGTQNDSPQILEYSTFKGGPMTVMWSDQSDPTVWTSLTGNTAQTGRTMQGGDYFVGGIAVRDGTSLIFTNRCTFAMTYSGDYLVYDTPLLADNAGLVSPYAVTAEGGIAVWMNDCDLYSWNGSVAPVPTDDVRSTVFGNLNPAYLYKTVAGFNRAKKQVRFWYPSTASSTENDGCLILQMDSLCFSTSTIARTGWTDSILAALPYGVDSLGNLYQEETGYDANGQPIATTLTFSPTDISNGDRCVDMFGFTPDFRSQIGSLQLSINTQYYPQDPVMVTGPMTIAADDTTAQIDLRCDGSLIGWTVVSNVVGGFFRMGLCRVDFQPSGSHPVSLR